MAMNPRALRALAEIVDLGSFSRAAESLNITQPTLSHAIKQLEAVVGAPVLRRSRHGVSATRIGGILADQGRAIRAALVDAETGLTQWRSGIEGRLRVGVGPMVAQTIMPHFVEDALASRWNIALWLCAEGAHRVVANVRTGDFDLGLAASAAYYGEDDLVKEVMFRDEVGVYVGTRHRLAKRTSIRPADLEGLDWIGGGPVIGARDSTSIVIERLGLKRPVVVMEFSGDVAMPLRLLATGKYIGVLPNFLMRYVPNRDRYVQLPIKTPREPRDVALWYRRDMESHPNIVGFRTRFQAFVERLK